MIRKIIEIDQEKCNGCGACAKACHEGAIGMIKGKATLLRDDYCDGLGDCLPTCPTGAISFVEREAQEYDAAAVARPCQWPVQLKLAPMKAPYFDGGHLLMAADCTAYAYKDFHNEFMKGRLTLIGCPKLDAIDYTEKLTEILKQNDIKSVILTRMEVPCCGRMESTIRKAIELSGKDIPLQVTIISVDGKLLSTSI